MKYPMTPKVPTNDSSIRYRVLSYLPSSPEAHIGTNAEGGCETVHRLVVLPTQVEEDSQATLHIRVNGCRVQAHSCQEELFHFEKQGAGHGRKKKCKKAGGWIRLYSYPSQIILSLTNRTPKMRLSILLPILSLLSHS